MQIKSQFSSLLFREGVFNPMGKGLTVYIRARGADGELHGLMIHDGRPQNRCRSPSSRGAARW